MRFSSARPKIPTLGSLEVAVLRESWSSPQPVDAQCVLERVGQGRITLSTVQATLERLCRKDLLTRQKVGRAYVYSAGVSQSQLIGTLIRDLTQRFAAGELEPVISGFVDLVGDAGPELLEQLGAAAERRRAAIPPFVNGRLTMNKPAAILGVVVVLGAAIVGSRWQRTEPAVTGDTPAADARLPATPSASTAAPELRAATQAVEVPATNTDVRDRDTDEHSAFGHGSDQGDVETQLSTSPDYPERAADAEGASLAPALADTRATLAQLLAEAGPEALAEVTALGDTRAALEGLLEDPDPAVREQVAALLEVLGTPAP